MTSHTYLDKIIEATRRRLAEAMSARPLEALRDAARDARRESVQHAFRQALSDASRVNVIAEFKRASPSKGEINAGASVAETARRYAAGGARALSVLTEEDFFRGSLDDLREAKRACSLPVLRKDFVVDEFQVYEAAEAGADAVLLIVAALDGNTLHRLRVLIEEELGMDALVEVHDAEEMERASAAGATLVGVNNRNLRTFDVSLDVSARLAPLAPAGALLVSESGIRDDADIAQLRGHGYRAFLVGETLMRAGRPEEVLKELTE